MSERSRRRGWLLVMTGPILLLVILETVRYFWLARTVYGYASHPAAAWWVVGEVGLVAVATGLLAYRQSVSSREEVERAMADLEDLGTAAAALREENAELEAARTALNGENAELQAATEALRREQAGLVSMVEQLRGAQATLQEAVETLRSREPVTFVSGEHPPLLDLLLQGQLDEANALGYLRQTARVLARFHDQGVPYLLAPDTVVVDLDQRTAYLRQQLIGIRTPTTVYAGWSPPEILTSQPSPQVDVFGLGALLYALYTRQMLPAGDGLGKALEHLNIASAWLGLDYLLRKALWPHIQFRLGNATEFLALLDSIQDRSRGGPAERAVALDIGADFNVGLGKGRNRGHRARDNEDRLFWDMDERGGLCLLTVADGVTRSDIGTGYRAAAAFADEADQVWQRLQRDPAGMDSAEEVLSRLFAGANRRIVRDLAERLKGRVVTTGEATMATAACAALCRGPQVTIANMGDVRAYLATPHWAGRVTADDSVLSQALLDPVIAPEQWASLSGSTLSDYLGRWRLSVGGELEPAPLAPHISTLALAPDEALVLASDGVYSSVRGSREPFEDALLKILASVSDAQVAAFRLMSMANQRGGEDNISCIVCRCRAADGDA